jgi:hypothetical protein
MEVRDDHNDPARWAPTLHQLPKLDPFVVPEGFFEHFPHRVGAAIRASQASKARRWPVPMRWAMALPVLFLAGGAIWWFMDVPVDAVAANYEVLAPIDLLDISDALGADVLAYVEDEGAIVELGQVDIGLDENELLAYLERERIDLSELIIELE